MGIYMVSNEYASSVHYFDSEDSAKQFCKFMRECWEMRGNRIDELALTVQPGDGTSHTYVYPGHNSDLSVVIDYCSKVEWTSHLRVLRMLQNTGRYQTLDDVERDFLEESLTVPREFQNEDTAQIIEYLLLYWCGRDDTPLMDDTTKVYKRRWS